MERSDRAPLSTFHAPGAWGPEVELDERAAHHALVKRLSVGDPVRLTSGDGRRTPAVITELARRRFTVTTLGATLEEVAAPSAIELWAPVGDRDRMLWLAEKSTELGVTAWRPVLYRRSRSVSPRGEGEAFREKLRARMIAALEQSGGAWLPTQLAEATLDEALEASGSDSRILLDVSGAPIGDAVSPLIARASTRGIALALGPEGGLDADERDALLGAGWRAASLGPNVLRFETAAIAALAIIRSHQW